MNQETQVETNGTTNNSTNIQTENQENAVNPESIEETSSTSLNNDNNQIIFINGAPVKITASIITSYQKSKHPDFKVGDSIRINYKIKEGEKERIQVYEGVVIAIRGEGMGKTFIVRRISHEVGVERIFPYYSPFIQSITIIRKGKIRRARLFYLRDKTGKESRIKEAFSILQTEDETLKNQTSGKLSNSIENGENSATIEENSQEQASNTSTTTDNQKADKSSDITKKKKTGTNATTHAKKMATRSSAKKMSKESTKKKVVKASSTDSKKKATSKKKK